MAKYRHYTAYLTEDGQENPQRVKNDIISKVGEEAFHTIEVTTTRISPTIEKGNIYSEKYTQGRVIQASVYVEQGFGTFKPKVSGAIRDMQETDGVAVLERRVVGS